MDEERGLPVISPVRHWNVVYVVRPVGAIGRWERMTVRVESHSRESAFEVAFKQLHADGYETHHPVGAVEVGVGQDERESHEGQA